MAVALIAISTATVGTGAAHADAYHYTPITSEYPRGLCMDGSSGANGSQVRMQNGGACANWALDVQSSDVTGFWAYIRDASLNQCLDADATHIGNGDKVQIWTCNYQSQQLWHFEEKGNCRHDFVIRNGANTSYVLDARTDNSGNPATPGDPLQLWTYISGASNQAWNEPNFYPCF